MGDSFAIFALRRKRAKLAGEILAAQTALGKKRDALATLDAVIRMFEPQTNPDLIAPIRPSSRRCLYFRHGEQMRLAICALREAGKPISCREVAEYAMAAKGLARKIVEWPETWWELVG